MGRYGKLGELLIALSGQVDQPLSGLGCAVILGIGNTKADLITVYSQSYELLRRRMSE